MDHILNCNKRNAKHSMIHSHYKHDLFVLIYINSKPRTAQTESGNEEMTDNLIDGRTSAQTDVWTKRMV